MPLPKNIREDNGGSPWKWLCSSSSDACDNDDAWDGWNLAV